MVIRPMSIRYLSRNTSRKFRALINDDYIELYCNNMFLLRAQLKLDHDRPVLEFTQPGFDITRGQYRISNIHVTKWNHSAPPFSEGAESLADYYSTYLQEFPNDAWGYLWRGIARLKLNQFAAAEQDIVKSMELGCPVCYAGFFLGDCFDRQGKTALAIEWYQKTVDPKGREVAYFAEGVDDALVTEPLMWAASRLDYLAELLPDRELAKQAIYPVEWKDKSFFWITPVSCPGNWVVGLNRAIRRGDTRVVDNTIRSLRKEKFDFKDEVQFEEIIQKVSKYEEYRDPPGAEPQYLKLDLSPWYFRLANETMAPQLLERLYSW
jgi:tetratricopeptide (TPR) repeat protein